MNHFFRRSLVVSYVLTCFGLLIPLAAAEPNSKWTRFRGENGEGRIAECNVPLPWQSEDVAWEVKLPGKGNGSPVVFEDRVYLMSANADTAERWLLAYDLRSGKEVWREAHHSEPYLMHARSSYASCTPCVNDRAVYFTWATPEQITLIAYSHAGEVLWNLDLGSFSSQHGYGASPVLFDDKLVLFNSQGAQDLPQGMKPGETTVMAFAADTGEQLWETPRTTTRVCYGLPTRFKDESGKDALLFANTGDGLFALALEDGEPLWNKQVFGKRCVSCPIIVGDLAIGTEGSGGGGNVLYGVSLTGEHDLKLTVDRSAPYVPTPVAKGELLFLWGDQGIVSCVHAPSGRTVWSKRIGGNVSTSPVIAGDKLVGIAEDGTLTVLAASEQFKELGSVRLDDTTRATPLLSENYILVRTDSKLLCIGKP